MGKATGVFSNVASVDVYASPVSTPGYDSVLDTPILDTPILEREVDSSEIGYKGLLKARRVLKLAILCSVAGIVVGSDLGVTSGILPTPSFLRDYPSIRNPQTKGWVVSSMTVSAMLGSGLGGPISDKLSRRWSIVLSSAINIIGCATQAGSRNLAMLVAGRAMAGFSLGILTTVVPLYLSEISGPNVRGAAMSLLQLGITFGVMLGFWITYGLGYIGGPGEFQSSISWRLSLGLRCVPGAVMTIGGCFLPYSPRWLALKGRENETAASLVHIRQVPVTDRALQSELLDIMVASRFDAEVKEKASNGGRSSFLATMAQYAELFTSAHLNRRLAIACILQVFTQLTGISAILYYAPTIFRDVGLSGSAVALLATGVSNIVNFIMTIPAAMYVDRWGRRKTLLFGILAICVSHLIISTLSVVYQDSWDGHGAAGWVCVSFVWAFIASFAVSVGCLASMIPAELFSSAHRARATGFAISVNWLVNYTLVLTTPRLMASLRGHTFFIFFGSSVLFFIWVYFIVPETRGVPIEEMDRIFGGNDGQETAKRMKEIRMSILLEGRWSQRIQLMGEKIERV